MTTITQTDREELERVARAMEGAVTVWLRTPSDRRTRDEVMAAAAMAAAYEIAAKALRAEAMCLPNTHTACTHKHANWLTQRAASIREAV